MKIAGKTEKLGKGPFFEKMLETLQFVPFLSLMLEKLEKGRISD